MASSGFHRGFRRDEAGISTVRRGLGLGFRVRVMGLKLGLG